MRTTAEAEKIQKELHARNSGYRSYLCPQFSRFEELFENVRKFDKNRPAAVRLPAWDVGPHDPESMRTIPVGPYCRVEPRDAEGNRDRTYPSLGVDPKPEVVAAIRPRYIAGKCDRLTFEVIEWDNGQALVTYENSQIIGGGWLTMIDAASIPPASEVAEA